MWAKIRDDVIAGLKKVTHTKRLVITGISLGGGLACISYVDIAASGVFETVEVVTYGAPRVGNRKWARWFDSITPSTRIFIKNDPIAYLPRCLTPLCNYKQTGTAVVCRKGKKVCKARGVGETEDELEWTEETKTFFEEINEHKEELAEGDVEGILDHIYGYKKIRDFTLIL